MLRANRNHNEDSSENCDINSQSNCCPNKKFLYIIISLFIILLGSYYFFSKKELVQVEEVIIISADEDESDNKIQPSDPGGMVVSNMDKDIYDTIDKNVRTKKDEDTEVLLSPTEEPIKKSEILANNSQEVSSKEQVISEIKPEDKVEDFVKATTQSKSKKHKKFSKKQDQTFRVQIASFKSKKDAEKQWNILTKKYSKLLGNLDHFIVSKDIPGKGIFQRLQVGPFQEQRAAKTACSKFKDNGLNCFIIKP